MENPNEYNEDNYTRESNKLFEAVAGMWEAGADRNDIETQFSQALEQAEGE